MNILKRSPQRWKKKAFESIAFLNLFLFPLVLNLFASTNGFGETEFLSSTRYAAETTQHNTVDETVSLKLGLSPFLELSPLARVSVSSKDLESLRFGISARFPLFSFFEFVTRFSQQTFFPESFSTSELFFLGRLISPEIWIPVRFFAAAGWYKRYNQLAKTTFPAVPFRNSLSEHDFSFEIGLSAFESSPYFFTTRVATFDGSEAFNLNHPYAEIEIGHRLSENLTLALFSRYQILLGFGRMDRLLGGVNLWMPLST